MFKVKTGYLSKHKPFYQSKIVRYPFFSDRFFCFAQTNWKRKCCVFIINTHTHIHSGKTYKQIQTSYAADTNKPDHSVVFRLAILILIISKRIPGHKKDSSEVKQYVRRKRLLCTQTLYGRTILCLVHTLCTHLPKIIFPNENLSLANAVFKLELLLSNNIFPFQVDFSLGVFFVCSHLMLMISHFGSLFSKRIARF